MTIITTICWDSAVKLEDSVSIQCTTTIEVDGEEHVFSMELDNGKKERGYLNGIQNHCLGISIRSDWGVIDRKPGKNVYDLHIYDPETDVKENLKHFKRFHGQFYLVTRDTTVSDENWCAFYGSNGMRWNSDLYNFESGTWSEQFVQTVYDATHINPKIYMWTNVGWKFFEAIERDSSLEERYQSIIQPIVREITAESNESRMLLLEKLLEIPLVRDRYKLQSISM